MKVCTQQQIWTDFCCSKQTDGFLLETFDFSCFWADVPFRGFVLHDAQTRWPMAQVSAAYAASTCSRSLRLSLRSTAQVTWRHVKHLIESCLIYCTCKQKQRFCWLPSVSDQLETEDLKNIWREIEMMNCHLYLKLGSESETKLPQIGNNFTRSWLPCWSEGCLSWLMSIEHKSLYAKLPNKKSWPMRLSKAACIWSSNISLPSTGRKKYTSLLCVGTGWCVWMRD